MLSRGFKDQIYDVYRYLPPELQVSVTLQETTLFQFNITLSKLPSSFLSTIASGLLRRVYQSLLYPELCGLQILSFPIIMRIMTWLWFFYACLFKHLSLCTDWFTIPIPDTLLYFYILSTTFPLYMKVNMNDQKFIIMKSLLEITAFAWS